MTDPVSGIFRQPFAEQVAAWRLRLQELRPTQAWTDVTPEFHDSGFMVAGATKADLLADLAGAVDKAIAEGRSLDEFRRDFREIVRRRGWHGWTGEGSKKGEAWRTRVIYRTNMSTTYHAGRRAQLLEGGFAFWIYRHGGSREPRIVHLGFDGLALPPDHEFWIWYSTPNGWGCSCYMVGARTRAGIRRMGGDPDKVLPANWRDLDPKTGAPKGIDKGWAYAPGARNDDIMRQIREKAANLPDPLGAALDDIVRRPARPPVEGEDFRAAIAGGGDTAAIDRLVLDSGLAFRAGSGGFQASGYAEIAAHALEVQRRFGLPPLRYFGSSGDYPFQPPLPKQLPTALYDASKRSIAFRPAATDAAWVGRTYDPDPMLDHNRINASVWQAAMEAASEQVRERGSGMAYPGWSVIKTSGGVATHEIAHHLHYQHRYEVDRLVADNAMLGGGWHLLLSSYAGTDAYEFFAEAVTLYMLYGEDQHFRLHPRLLEFLRRMDRGLR